MYSAGLFNACASFCHPKQTLQNAAETTTESKKESVWSVLKHLCTKIRFLHNPPGRYSGKCRQRSGMQRWGHNDWLLSRIHWHLHKRTRHQRVANKISENYEFFCRFGISQLCEDRKQQTWNWQIISSSQGNMYSLKRGVLGWILQTVMETHMFSEMVEQLCELGLIVFQHECGYTQQHVAKQIKVQLNTYLLQPLKKLL